MFSKRLLPIAVTAVATACGSSSDPVAPPPPPPVQAPPPPTPSVAGVRPSSVAPGTTRDIKVTGSNFASGVRIEFARGTVDPQLAVTPVSASATEVVVRLTVTSQATEAAFDVVATNPSGQSGTGRGMLIVDRVPADELTTPDSAGAVTAVLASGAAFGIVTGGCVDGDLGTPVAWSATGALQQLGKPAELGCRVHPLKATDTDLFGRGDATNAGSPIAVVRWSVARFAVQLDQLTAPPVAHRFTFDAVGADGIYLGHATDTSTAQGLRFPFVWKQGSGWTQLQRPAGFDSCLPLDANGLGVVVGRCYKGAGRDEAPVLWAAAAAVPTLLPLPSGATTGLAQGVNAAGVIVGGAGRVAVRWTPAAAGWSTEILPDPGSGALGYHINDDGWVTGTAGTSPARAALWSPTGVLQVLGRLDVNGVCAPNAIAASTPTNAPIVGGRCFRPGASGPDSRPVLWRP